MAIGEVLNVEWAVTVYLLASLADHSAGDFHSSITRRLRVEVIRITVYHHSFSNNIMHRKPICSYSQICVSPTFQQGW